MTVGNSLPAAMLASMIKFERRKDDVDIYEELTTIIDFLRLNARQSLISEFFYRCPSSRYVALREQALRNGLLFDFEGQSNSKTFGWIGKNIHNSLVANLAFLEIKALYPKLDFDNVIVTPRMLVNVCLLFNMKYKGQIEPVDINKVYSIFEGMMHYEVYANTCCCGRNYIRTTIKNTNSCPWCRAKSEEVNRIICQSNTVSVPERKSVSFYSFERETG